MPPHGFLALAKLRRVVEEGWRRARRLAAATAPSPVTSILPSPPPLLLTSSLGSRFDSITLKLYLTNLSGAQKAAWIVEVMNDKSPHLGTGGRHLILYHHFTAIRPGNEEE